MTKEALKLALEALEFYYDMHEEEAAAKAFTAIKEALAKPPLPVQEPVKLRRGDILRCIETDELCTVWATSTTGTTLIKWSANNFGSYTAEQIGELFWIEPREAEPVAWDKPSASFNEWWDSNRHDNANPFDTDSFAYWAWEGWQAALAQRPWVGLTPEEILDLFDRHNVYGSKWIEFARTVETKLNEKNK